MKKDIQFKLVITEDGNEMYSSSLSYDAVNTIVSSAQDAEDNNDLFFWAAQHPVSAVRETVAYKDNLNKKILEILSTDKSISVLRNLVRTGSFKKFASQELLEKLIQLDTEIAQNIASDLESFQDADASMLIDILSKHDDPSVLMNLVQNYSTPKKVLKSFLNHPDRGIAIEAKLRLQN